MAATRPAQQLKTHFQEIQQRDFGHIYIFSNKQLFKCSESIRLPKKLYWFYAFIQYINSTNVKLSIIFLEMYPFDKQFVWLTSQQHQL